MPPHAYYMKNIQFTYSRAQADKNAFDIISNFFIPKYAYTRALNETIQYALSRRLNSSG